MTSRDWNSSYSPTETQERIIGRTKLADIELDDATKPTSAHNALTMIDENGKELQIVEMPFGKVGDRRIRHLFHRLLPHAAGDRADDREHVRGRRPATTTVLDFSRAADRNVLVPSATFLDALGDDPATPAAKSTGATAKSAARPQMARWNRLAQRRKGSMRISTASSRHLEAAGPTSKTRRRARSSATSPDGAWLDVEVPGGVGLSADRDRPPQADRGAERGAWSRDSARSSRGRTQSPLRPRPRADRRRRARR